MNEITASDISFKILEIILDLEKIYKINIKDEEALELDTLEDLAILILQKKEEND